MRESNELKKADAVYGTRMIGGEFGGSVLALSKCDLSEEMSKSKKPMKMRLELR